jgi:hypothetical protein
MPVATTLGSSLRNRCTWPPPGSTKLFGKPGSAEYTCGVQLGSSPSYPVTVPEVMMTRLASDFDLRDFDVSEDGRELVVERAQERSDIVLIDRARRD